MIFEPVFLGISCISGRYLEHVLKYEKFDSFYRINIFSSKHQNSKVSIMQYFT
jgi:hypothetical protein